MRTTDVKGSKSPTRKVGDTSGGEARSWLHKRSDPELWPGDRHSSGLYRAGSGNPEGDLFHRPGQESWTLAFCLATRRCNVHIHECKFKVVGSPSFAVCHQGIIVNKGLLGFVSQ